MLFTVILIAISLAMDCFSVSLTAGVCNRKAPFLSVLTMALMFGAFQMLMPYIGYFAGMSFIDYVRSFDHWIAFGILLFIGLNMILPKEETDDDEQVRSFYEWKTLLLLSVATSIDALATGLVFVSAEGQISYHLAFGIIGVVSLLMSLMGNFVGRQLGKKVTFRFEIVGGVVLILIGVKVLVEHLFA